MPRRSAGVQSWPNWGVRRTIRPSGLRSSRHCRRNSPGSATCSMTWLAVTTSYRRPLAAWEAAVPTSTLSLRSCRARATASASKSTPATRQPRRAITLRNRPSPQPMSSKVPGTLRSMNIRVPGVVPWAHPMGPAGSSRWRGGSTEPRAGRCCRSHHHGCSSLCRASAGHQHVARDSATAVRRPGSCISPTTRRRAHRKDCRAFPRTETRRIRRKPCRWVLRPHESRGRPTRRGLCHDSAMSKRSGAPSHQRQNSKPVSRKRATGTAESRWRRSGRGPASPGMPRVSAAGNTARAAGSICLAVPQRSNAGPCVLGRLWR